MNAPIVSVHGLSCTFDMSRPWLDRMIERRGRALVKAVDDISFEIASRTTYALVGESGSGKSTVARAITGLLRPTRGKVRFATNDTTSRSSDIPPSVQMVFQDPYASLNPRWRAADIITEPLVASRAPTAGAVERLLEQVGLDPRVADHFPHQFSGGQRQRLAIARALAKRPELIVFDEPTSALDVSVQAQVLNLMQDLQEQLGLTYLFITHDLSVVEHMAHTVGVLYLGQLVEEASTARLFTSPQHPYTQMLLAAAPRIDGDRRDRALPKGEIPDPANPPKGCPFHPRCPKAEDICRRQRPQQTRVLQGHRVACHFAAE